MAGGGECNTVAAGLGGSEVQVDWSGPKVCSRLALVLFWPTEPGELSLFQFTATMTLS